MLHLRLRDVSNTWSLAMLLAMIVILSPGPAAADSTGQNAAPQATCDMAPYERHLQQILGENEQSMMQEQGMLFSHLASTDPANHTGIVNFGITSDGHVVDAKLQQSTGSPAVDTLLLAAVRNSKFDPLPACFPLQVMPVKFRFNIPVNTGD